MQLRDMDVSTTVVTRDQLAQMPEITADQIVSHLAGTYTSAVPTYGVHPTGQAITMRGFGGRGAERTLVMMDGVPVNDAFFRYINWMKMPKESIERIEVIRGGGATSLWGNMAMGGVINIVTRPPQPGELRATFAGGFPAATGLFDMAATVFDQNNLRIGLTANYFRTEGYNQTRSDYQNTHLVATEAQAENLGIRADWTPTVETRIYAKLLYHTVQEYGLVYDISKNNWNGIDLTLGGQTKFGDANTIDVNAWYSTDTIVTHNASAASSYNYRVPTSGNGNAIFLGAVGKTPYYDYGGSLVWSRDVAPWLTDVKAGVDARNIVGGDSTAVFNQAGTQTTLSQVHGQQWFQGVFVQGTFHAPFVPLDITIGLREDFWRVSDGVFNGRALPAGSQYTRFDPRVGLKYHLTQDIDLRAAFYRNFGAPGMNQTFRTFYSGNNAFQANSALAPEYNTGYEAGADWRIGTVTLGVTAFHNDLTSVIDSATICGAGGLPSCSVSSQAIGNTSQFTRQSKYFNVGNATVEGFEVLADWRATETLKFNSSFTFSRSVLTDNAGIAAIIGRTVANTAEPLNNQLANVPSWTALAGFTWTPDPQFSLSMNVKGFPAYWADTAHTVRNDGAAVIDISASYRMQPGVEFFVTGQNIGNRTYVASGSTGASTPPGLAQPIFFLVGVRLGI